MKNNRLNLPLGIQTFEEIRTRRYVYVDKTQQMAERQEKSGRCVQTDNG